MQNFAISQRQVLVWLYCRTTTKGPKWHNSSFDEFLMTIPFIYKALVWMTRQLSLHRQRMTIVLFVLYHNWLTFNAGHLYWTFNLSRNVPLCKWHKLKETQGRQCHLGPFVMVQQHILIIITIIANKIIMIKQTKTKPKKTKNGCLVTIRTTVGNYNVKTRGIFLQTDLPHKVKTFKVISKFRKQPS